MFQLPRPVLCNDAAVTEIKVRVMLPGEYEAMRNVSVAAFDDPSIGELIDSLRASWAWDDELSFVAEQSGDIVGQVLFTEAIVDAPNELVRVLVLSPVGIKPELHGLGIGTSLITQALDAIAQRPEPAVFLEGNPRYYERFGFVAASELGFRRPSLRIPAAAFQVRPQPAWSPELSGPLVYPDAFWLTDSVGLR